MSVSIEIFDDEIDRVGSDGKRLLERECSVAISIKDSDASVGVHEFAGARSDQGDDVERAVFVYIGCSDCGRCASGAGALWS